MDFLAKYKFRFELWPAPADFDDNTASPKAHTHGWLLTEAEKLACPSAPASMATCPTSRSSPTSATWKRPSWKAAGIGPSWLSRFSPAVMVQRPRPPLHGAAGKGRNQDVRRPSRNRELDDALREIGHLRLVHLSRRCLRLAVNDWRATIQKKLRLGLDELSAMYNRKDHPFKSFAEVTMPEVATLSKACPAWCRTWKANGISGPSRIRTKGSRANGGTPT